MPTKAELEKENKKLVRAVALYFFLAVIFIITIGFLLSQMVSMNACLPESEYPLNTTGEFQYGYPTVTNEFINLSGLDPSCIIRVRDFRNVGGSVWADIEPMCVEVIQHTYRSV